MQALSISEKPASWKYTALKAGVIAATTAAGILLFKNNSIFNLSLPEITSRFKL